MNWQNFPDEAKRAVLPKRGALVFADYSQIEPRLTAYFASNIGHPDFAEQIRQGTDSYTAVAKLVTGKDSVTDEERQTWKRVFLSLVYGGGAPSVQRYLPHLDYPGAKALIQKFHRQWPAVQALQAQVKATEQDRGFLRTPWGRHLHKEEYGEHKLLNKLIQGSAADLMKHAILVVDERLRYYELSARLVSVIHDELILDAPLDEVAGLAQVLPNWMSQPALGRISEIVPITADVKVSETNWRDKIDYQEWRNAARV